MIHLIDASSILRVWNACPPEAHPDLWAWIAKRIAARNFQIIDAIDAEVKVAVPECHAWLHASGINVISTEGRIELRASEIAASLGIVGNNYGDGVGWNDLLLIAAAEEINARVVSEEGRQKEDARREGWNCKIPAVCEMLGISCVSLVWLIRRSGKFPHLFVTGGPLS